MKLASRPAVYIALACCMVWALPVRAAIWPGQPGYGGTSYAFGVGDPVGDSASANTDIVSVYTAQDATPGNEFYFFRVTVQAQSQNPSQFVKVMHVVYIDTNGDGTFDYITYNTTKGGAKSELGSWDGSQWNAGLVAYTTNTLDSDNADNYIELAVPTGDIGSPSMVVVAAGAGTGALALDGNTSNAPDPALYDDIAVPEPGSVGLALVFMTTAGVVGRWRKRRSG